MSAAASRRAKWPAPPPSPKILHLPRRFTRPSSSKKPSPQDLRSLLAQEKTTTAYATLGRDAPTSTSSGWKLHKSRGRKKIDGNDGIEKQMGKLKARSAEVADYDDGTSSSQPSSSPAKHKQDINVEMLKRKMEGQSKGMLERMEEYCGMSLLVSADDGDPDSDHAAGKKSSSYSGTVHHVAEAAEARKQRSQCRRAIGGRRGEDAAAGSATSHQIQGEEAGKMGYGCCCRRKEVLARITAEVKAESAQWAEMKAMLDRVRLEMEELRSSRDQWQRRAVASELSLRTLHSHAVEWRRRARAAEEKVSELQERRGQQLEELSTSDDWNFVRLPRIKCRQRPEGSPEAVEKEKHVLVCRLKNSGSDMHRRAPLAEIGNLDNSAASTTASMK